MINAKQQRAYVLRVSVNVREKTIRLRREEIMNTCIPLQ